jgi:hypothetical protein
MLDDAIEELVEIDVGGIDLWFGVESGASVCVEFPELCNEVFVLRGPVDEMLWDPVGRRHRGRVRPQGRRNRNPPGDAIQDLKQIQVGSRGRQTKWLAIRVVDGWGGVVCCGVVVDCTAESEVSLR